MCVSEHPSSRRRIVIIGGSHSAFSAAWVCLNRLQREQQQQQQQHAAESSQTQTQTQTAALEAGSIYIIHRGPIKVTTH